MNFLSALSALFFCLLVTPAESPWCRVFVFLLFKNVEEEKKKFSSSSVPNVRKQVLLSLFLSFQANLLSSVLGESLEEKRRRGSKNFLLFARRSFPPLESHLLHQSSSRRKQPTCLLSSFFSSLQPLISPNSSTQGQFSAFLFLLVLSVMVIIHRRRVEVAGSSS